MSAYSEFADPSGVAVQSPGAPRWLIALEAAVCRAGYYRKWKATFGDEAWAMLEKYSGPLV